MWFPIDIGIVLALRRCGSSHRRSGSHERALRSCPRIWPRSSRSASCWRRRQRRQIRRRRQRRQRLQPQPRSSRGRAPFVTTHNGNLFCGCQIDLMYIYQVNLSRPPSKQVGDQKSCDHKTCDHKACHLPMSSIKSVITDFSS